MRSLSYGLILICLLLLCVIPVSAATAEVNWTLRFGYCITALETNPSGSMIFVGLGNGTIYGLNSSNSTVWVNATNASAGPTFIKKIISTNDGSYIVWSSASNQTGMITGTTGTVLSVNGGTGRNITDIAVRSDGSMYAVSELNPPRITIYYQNGTIYAQNTSYGSATYWTSIAYDPLNTWLLSSNQSNNTVYFWNVSGWDGWEQFNPLHLPVKNTSQIFLDQFLYRENVSIAPNTASTGLVFYNVTNVTTPTKRLDGSYFYNRLTTGPYIYFTLPGNLSNNQTALINFSTVNSSGTLFVVLRPGYTNYTMYYGCTTYSNQIVNQSWTNNGTIFRANLTSGTSSWTVPSSVYAVNLTMYGGGGGGQAGGVTGAPSYGYGAGGSAAALTQHNNIKVSPGSSYSVIIGSGGIGGAEPGGVGGNGVNSSFSNGTFYNATGGLGGTGYAPSYAAEVGDNGNMSVGITGYPNASAGTDGRSCGNPCTGTCYSTPGASGGTGVGSGGGGGGAESATCSGTYGGTGGAGAAGIIQVSYYVNDIPVYYYGATPSTHYEFVEQSRQSSGALNQSSSTQLVGTVIELSEAPSSGTLATVSTDTILYQLPYISSVGIGTPISATYPPSSGGGPVSLPGQTPHSLKVSSSGVATVEGRGSYTLVYDNGAVLRASLATGGEIRSVDGAVTSGTFAVFGGDEGKIYMFSKDSTWYNYYTGTTSYPIGSVATTWAGDAVVVGRFDSGSASPGFLEYYLTNVTIPVTPTSTLPSTPEVSVRVFKDGAVYANQPVTVYSSATAPYVWLPVGTSYTDGSGRMSYTTTYGVYYKFVVNNVPGTTSGEGETIWQSNAASTTVYVYVLSASTPYDWNAYYNNANDNVTVIYSDTITPSSVTVTIKDLKTNLVVLTRTYTSTPSFTLEYHDNSGTGSYQVSIVINRLSTTLRDQRIVSSPDAYGTILPVDNYIIWAISTVVLMLIAGMFSYTNSKRGAFAVVVIAGIMMIFKLLPQTMVTVAMLAALFAVMSLFASRVT